MSDKISRVIVFGMLFIIFGTLTGSLGFYFGYREGVFQVMQIKDK